jgi:hypothetical protein
VSLCVFRAPASANNDEIFGNGLQSCSECSKFYRQSKVGKYGSTIYFQTSFEQISVEETNNRFINIPGIVNPNVFDNQRFAGATFKYSFENYDILHFLRWDGILLQGHGK